MFAKLTALVGGGYTFPYQAEEPYGTAWGQWTHYRGKSKDDGSPVSIFKISAADANDKKLVCARNGVKRLKMMRHPNLLAFKDSNEATEKGATVIQLVTEPVKPLKDVMLELGLEGQHRDEYFSMGMLHIANAVSFLNNDAKLIHGNLCMAAVVVTPGLDWKLHAFDLLSEHSLPPDNTLQEASWMVGKQYQPGELARGEWDVIRQGPPWAVDAWGLGCLTQEVFSCTEMTSVENLRHTEGIPKALLGDYQKLLSSAPARRLNPAKVAQSPFLHNRLVEVVAFMENIAVKDSVEKESFFRRLPGILPAIPAPVAVGKLLPLLASALEFGGAPPLAVSSLMVIGGHLQGDDFNKRVVPCLSKLFASSDRALRRSLLESLDQYAPHLTTGVIEDQIYPSLQTGFTDSHAYIRELTLKSILSLAPKMSNKTLVTSVLKHLSKLQVDEEPSIRANTTVLLGSIAPHLGDATCRRVLLNAFTRALKDTFPPARIAGLRALVATKQHYSAEDVAVRLLPCTTPLAMDPVPEVRAGSLACLETFTQVLKEEEEVRRAKEAAAAEAAGYMPGAQQSGGGGGMGSMSGMGSAGSSSATSFFGAQASGMLSWAVSGLMNTVGGPAPPGAAAAGAAAPAGGAATAPKVVSPASKGPSAPAAAAAKPAAAAKAGGEGWGDGDGWDEDELEIDEAELAARARLALKTSTASTSSRPAPAPAPAGRSSGGGGSRFSAEDPAEALTSAGGGWGDDADEDNVWEGMNTGAAAAPAPPAPKPAAAAAPRPAAAAAPGGAAAAAAARRAAQAAARAAGEGAGKPKLGAMKLGATKPAAPAPAPLPDTDGW
ncbi:hypothetical protein HYH03_001416 [Edaphochlamys debaryana]|uniref:Protein kinase domain-containing protein n=1 Tax=Edaphochlamys debaryana TaxID=47281 RepID=A0A836C682_9CHLO|nr:hypothetical protein HYH03_001416 [Edaphochlamys debaryana]|eukprot:KAG2500649.1 hypothetical protein HYH03_001416 [Edaphochlamys debaryana]